MKLSLFTEFVVTNVCTVVAFVYVKSTTCLLNAVLTSSSQIVLSDCEWCLDRGIPLLGYRMCFFKVIPVAIGTDADSNELEKVTANRKNLVTSPKDEGPKSLGRKIMSAVIKGDVLLILLTDY